MVPLEHRFTRARPRQEFPRIRRSRNRQGYSPGGKAVVPDDYDYKEYLGVLGRLLSNQNLIDEPKSIGELMVIRKSRDGEIQYWDEDRKRINLCNGSAVVTIQEYAEVQRTNRLKVTEHHYHFQPKTDGLHEYRIDLETDGDLHANSDQRLWGKNGIKEHMYFPHDTGLDIRGFNTLFTLIVALLYLRSERYPLKRGHEAKYNQALERYRRRLA